MQASIVSALSIAISTAMLFVQQGSDNPRAQQDQPRLRQSGERMQFQQAHLEQQMASWLALDNRNEVMLSQFAAERTQNSDVKQFAQMMVKEHSAYGEQLQPFLTAQTRGPRLSERGANPRGERPVTRPGDSSQRNTDDAERLPQADEQRTVDEPVIAPRRELPGSTPEGSAVIDPNPARNDGREDAAGRNTRDGQRGAGRSAMEQVAEQVAKNKLDMTKQMLEGYQGQDFDMGYLGQQILAHTNMLATLQAMQDQGSDQFRDVVTQGIQATQKHLKEAQRLAAQLEDKERGTSSSSPRPSNSGTKPGAVPNQ